jgi:hypothetical protein
MSFFCSVVLGEGRGNVGIISLSLAMTSAVRENRIEFLGVNLLGGLEDTWMTSR